MNRECQYSPEPLEEQTEATQAELFDALVEADTEAEESAPAGQLLSSGEVSAASAGVANKLRRDGAPDGASGRTGGPGPDCIREAGE